MAHLTRDGAPLVFAALLAVACSGVRTRGTRRSVPLEMTRRISRPRRPPPGAQGLERHDRKRVGTGNLITEPTFQFSPTDTVHVSIATEGSGAGQLTAAWRSQSGEILQKASEFARTGGENTAFSLSQPKGLKPGTYKVVVLLDDDSVDTKVFVVKK